MMELASPTRYQVEAQNLSRTSENKIHDDDVARRFGFSGALVPGVEVYAYACHIPVEVFGREWLQRGTMECRFVKPVYDARPVQVSGEPDGQRLTIRVESGGILCANATAGLGDDPAPAAGAYPEHPLPRERPPADETSLAPGLVLGTLTRAMSDEDAEWYLDGVRESDPLYRDQRIIHPGRILRLCNSILMDNVVLGPWIHVGSKVRNFALAHVGETLSVRGRVAANYEKKGHGFVDLDLLVSSEGERAIAHVQHTAIYRLSARD